MKRLIVVGALLLSACVNHDRPSPAPKDDPVPTMKPKIILRPLHAGDPHQSAVTFLVVQLSAPVPRWPRGVPGNVG